MSNAITINPRDHARAVIVLETDDQNSGFEILTAATAVDAAFYLSKNPALLAWLPAFAHGELRVFSKNAKVNGEPRHVFDLEIHGLTAIRKDDGKVDGIDDGQLELTESASSKGQWYYVNCPPGSGHWALKFCPSGQHALCNSNTGQVSCTPD